jgi:uncharacterized SAM-binding protein YcdF (DUF218 family)
MMKDTTSDTSRGSHPSAKQIRIRNGLLLCAAFLILAMVLLLVLPESLLIISDEPVNIDAIIVIGGDHKPERVQRAVELYREGYAPLVIISAGTLVQEGDEWLPEAEVMRRQARLFGLPERAMLLETDSQSTFENALFTRRICEANGIDRVLLVASDYHSRRARRIFRGAYEPDIHVIVQPAGESERSDWLFRLRNADVALYEYRNWLQYWFAPEVGGDFAHLREN